MVYGEKLLKKLLILHHLIQKNEWSLLELSWETGIPSDKLSRIIREMSKNYLIKLESNKIAWSPADNPSTIRPWGWRLIHKVLVGSTQQVAKGYGPWSIVVAEYQLEGKGRYSRKWISGLGGLWITASMSLSNEEAALLPIAVPVIILRSLETQFSINAKIKWPNDIIVDGRKVAGILIEAEAFPNRFITYVGIGINVNNDISLEDATSVKNIVGSIVPRNKILATIIGWFSRIRKLVDNREELVKQYMNNLDTLNRRVVIETAQGTIEGVVVDVSEDGSIIVESKAKKISLDPSDVYRLRYVD